MPRMLMVWPPDLPTAAPVSTPLDPGQDFGDRRRPLLLDFLARDQGDAGRGLAHLLLEPGGRDHHLLQRGRLFVSLGREALRRRFASHQHQRQADAGQPAAAAGAGRDDSHENAPC
ncbi:MAG: hypothetical protein KL785_02685 [Brevundimonas sp.]|nr:hypothetical protein [Brevundimonas sp.]